MADAQIRVQRICERAGDMRELRMGLVDELRRSIGFDFYAFLLTDPETSVGSAPLADVPFPQHELPELIRLKYLTALNRWTTLGEEPVALLEDPPRSLLWRELLSGHGVGDVASTVFRDRFGCWGFLDLWRAGRFSAAEAGLLSGIAEPITRALRRCQAATFLPGPPSPRHAGPVVLLLSPSLRVLGQTPQTHDYLQALLPPSPDRPPVPAGAYNVAAQLLAVEAGVDANPPSARVHLTGGLWLTMRAARIEQDIAVTIEESSAAERVDLFARAFALSARERELLAHLVHGGDTREVARRMFVSEHTVQDHLKSIFAKTATHNRRTLLSRALSR